MVRGRAVDMNCLRTLLNRLADAASYWLQTPFDAADELWNELRLRDGADRLAEREAEEEVAAAQFDEMWAEAVPVATTTDNGTGGGNYRVDRQSVFSSGGQTKETGPRPRISTPGPRVSDSDRLDRVLRDITDLRDRLDYLTELLVVLHHNTSAAPGIRSSVDAADGPRGTAAQPETRAGHPNPQ